MSKAPEQDPHPPLVVVGVLGRDGAQLVPELFDHVSRALRRLSSDRAIGIGFCNYVESLDPLPEVVA